MNPPLPVAIHLPSGITLRGHEWRVEGPPVALLHDLGEDLDAWGDVPWRLAAAGFRTFSIELRGHGLSDGLPDPAALEQDSRQLLAELRAAFGPVGLVCHGRAAVVAFALGPEDGAPVQVVLSPRPADWAIEPEDGTPALRLIVAGSLHRPSRAYLDRIYPRLRGQKLWITTATEDEGPRLLLSHPHLLEQVVTFLRRYLADAHRSPRGPRSQDLIEVTRHPPRR